MANHLARHGASAPQTDKKGRNKNVRRKRTGRFLYHAKGRLILIRPQAERLSAPVVSRLVEPLHIAEVLTVGQLVVLGEHAHA